VKFAVGALLFFLAATVMERCSGRAPSASEAQSAIAQRYDAAQAGDPFTLRNACHERLGDCAEDLGWRYAVERIQIKGIGRRQTFREKKLWPVQAELSLLCTCRGKSGPATALESVMLTDYGASGGWQVTSGL
jgi:hypothetical protein